MGVQPVPLVPGLLHEVHHWPQRPFQSSITVGSPVRESTKQAHLPQMVLKETICLPNQHQEAASTSLAPEVHAWPSGPPVPVTVLRAVFTWRHAADSRDVRKSCFWESAPSLPAGLLAEPEDSRPPCLIL